MVNTRMNAVCNTLKAVYRFRPLKKVRWLVLTAPWVVGVHWGNSLQFLTGATLLTVITGANSSLVTGASAVTL